MRALFSALLAGIAVTLLLVQGHSVSRVAPDEARKRFQDPPAGGALELPVVRDGKLDPVRLFARPLSVTRKSRERQGFA